MAEDGTHEGGATGAVKGKRNPPWVRDELILALDLYLRFGVIDPSRPEVIELSEFLNSLPIHVHRPDPEKFRNPNGVSLKLANFRSLDPSAKGKGMADVGKGDADVWAKFANYPQLVEQLATEIRRLGTSGSADISIPVDGEDEVQEGRIIFREHRSRERNRKIVEKKKKSVLDTTGRLACEVCDFEFGERYGDRGIGYIEVHHLVPLAEAGPTTTRVEDLAVVCANCHRIIHRKEPWLSPIEVKLLIAQVG